jgi:hypothetical protein
MYSAPGQTYQAQLETPSGYVPVEVEGQGAGSLIARIPASTQVGVGAAIQFPGLEGGLVGKVSGVSAGESDSFKEVYLQLPVNFFELRYVYIRR